MTKPVHFSIDRDKVTGGIQLSINDETGGYRIAGPKYCGMSETLRTHDLTEGDVWEIRRYLSRALRSINRLKQ